MYSVCARPTDERSLVRGGGEYNQGSFAYFDKALNQYWGIFTAPGTTSSPGHV